LVDSLRGADLKPFLELGGEARRRLRQRLFALLLEGSSDRTVGETALHSSSDCVLSLPARPNGYTDFYAGIVHATNVGRLLRPDNPLLPNYKYIPIGYHGRTSSIRVSGTPVRRPQGQLKFSDAETPTVA